MDLPSNEKLLRSLLRGLIFECPMGGNPENCQFHEIRKLTPARRLAWVQSLSAEECRITYAKHRECLACYEHESDERKA